jgi:hypothetical protein
MRDGGMRDRRNNPELNRGIKRSQDSSAVDSRGLIAERAQSIEGYFVPLIVHVIGAAYLLKTIRLDACGIA